MEMEGDEWRDGGWWTKMPWATTTINKRESRESVCVCVYAHERDSEMTSWQRATTSDEQQRVMSDDEWRATTSDERRYEQTKQQSTKVLGETRSMTVRVSDWQRQKYEHTNSVTVRTFAQHRIGSCHVVRKCFYGRHVTPAAPGIFFEKFLVRACKRAITVIRTYGTRTYVVCYTGRSTTDYYIWLARLF